MLAPTAAVALVVAHRRELRSAGAHVRGAYGSMRRAALYAPIRSGFRLRHCRLASAWHTRHQGLSPSLYLRPVEKASAGLTCPQCAHRFSALSVISQSRRCWRAAAAVVPARTPISTCRSSAISPPQWSAYSTQDTRFARRLTGPPRPRLRFGGAAGWRASSPSFRTGQGRVELAADWHPRTGCVAEIARDRGCAGRSASLGPHGPQAGRAT